MKPRESACAEQAVFFAVFSSAVNGKLVPEEYNYYSSGLPEQAY